MHRVLNALKHNLEEVMQVESKNRGLKKDGSTVRISWDAAASEKSGSLELKLSASFNGVSGTTQDTPLTE